MNTTGTVIVAFLAGIFLIVIVLAIATAIFISWKALQYVKILQAKLEEVQATAALDREEIKKILESGKNSFQSVKSDLTRAMEAQSSATAQTLRMFEDGFRSALKNLNGKAILDAVKTIPPMVRRLDEVAFALNDLVTSATETQATPREWTEPARADEHASEGQSRVIKSIYDTEPEEEETAKVFDHVTGDLFA